ncbi:MAG: DTW domain-containing protein YfiP [Porticoccus sp.]|jgi:DTW domain-containing protein YfiP
MTTEKRQICSRCNSPVNRCLCHTITAIDNHWPIHILQHSNESNHALGTAKIAQLSLSQCDVNISKITAEHERYIQTMLSAKPILVFPSSSSSALESINTDNARPLIFLDATWRKAKRLYLESELLQSLPTVHLQATSLPAYKIRKSPNPKALSSIEAIAEALSTLEANVEKYQPLLASMNWMVERQIELMGEKIYRENYFK